MRRSKAEVARLKACRTRYAAQREVESVIVAQVAQAARDERRDLAEELIDKAQRRGAITPHRAGIILAACGLAS